MTSNALPCIKCGKECSPTATGICKECRRVQCPKCGLRFSPRIARYDKLCGGCSAEIKYEAKRAVIPIAEIQGAE